MIVINIGKVKQILHLTSLLFHLVLGPCLVISAFAVEQGGCSVYSLKLMFVGVLEVMAVTMYYRRCKLTYKLAWYTTATIFVLINSGGHNDEVCSTTIIHVFMWCFEIMNYWRILLMLTYIFVFECPPHADNPPPQIINLDVLV